MRIRVLAKAGSVVALIVAVLIGWLWYAFFGHHHVTAQARPADFRNTADALQSTNAPLILAVADHFYWLNNGPAAAPLYARAEELLSKNGDKKNELHAHIGRLRSEAETMSFVDLSRYLNEQLQTPLLQEDKDLRLWCLIAKGYTDIELDYRATKQDWLEAKEIAKSLGQDQWVTRANGELGLVAFLEGNPGRAARLMGGALLSTMASGDVGGQIRFLELLGRGFEEVNRHAEAMRFFDRAIKLAEREKDSGLPFMAYEGKAQALVALGKPDDARAVIEDTLVKARAQQKRGHEAELLIRLSLVAENTGDTTQAIQYLEQAGQFATTVQFYRIEADAMVELAKLYRDKGDLATADARATQGVAASQRVGDRYYVPRNLTILADLKARRGRIAEANALYEQAEDVIEGMLISVDEPYWNSSVTAAMSQTYLQHFDLAAKQGDVPGAFRVLERVRGRTLAWALEDRKAFPTSESQQTAPLESEIATLQLRLMQSNNPDERERLLDQLTEYERRLGLAWTRDDAASQRLPVKPASLTTVQDGLKPDEALVEYVLDDPNSFCLSINKDGAHLQRLPAGRKEIERLTRAYIAEIREKRDGAEISKQLFTILVKPVRESAKATRVVVVPDGVLNLLPFDALLGEDGQFLIRSREITYAPSGTILITLRRAAKQQPAPRLALAVGDVVYENQGDASRRLPKPASLSARVERGIADLSGMALHDLPQTREEVEQIDKIVGHDSMVLLGKDATETDHGHENVVLIGHPTHADHAWISTLLAIRLPLFPKLKVRLTTLFAMELVRSVLANELHLALVTAPPSDANLTSVAFAETRLCAVFSDAHAAVAKEEVTLGDFANDEWILLPRNVNAAIHDTILETAAKAGIPFRQAHGVINAEQAFYLVSERAGVAILPRPTTLAVPVPGVVVRPLSDPALSFETCLVMLGGGSPNLPDSQLAPSLLYHNLGNGRFEVAKGFPELRIRGMGAAWGDYDERSV